MSSEATRSIARRLRSAGIETPTREDLARVDRTQAQEEGLERGLVRSVRPRGEDLEDEGREHASCAQRRARRQASVFVGDLARQFETHVDDPVLCGQLSRDLEIDDRLVGDPGGRDVDGFVHCNLDG